MPTTAAFESNPFSTRFVRPGALPYLFPADVTAAQLIDRLSQLGWQGQIVGKHGSGKSTLLHSLVQQIAKERQVVLVALTPRQFRLPLSRSDWHTLGEQSVLIVDGYQQLSRRARHRVQARSRRNGCGLLVTAHENVGLPTVFETSTSKKDLGCLVERLLSGKDCAVDEKKLGDMYDHCDGNVRETLFQLYDFYQSQRLRES